MKTSTLDHLFADRFFLVVNDFLLRRDIIIRELDQLYILFLKLIIFEPRKSRKSLPYLSTFRGADGGSCETIR